MLILSDCGEPDGDLSRMALCDGEVVGHLDQARADLWKGRATPEAQQYQPLLDELALHVTAGTLQRPTGGRDRAIVINFAPLAGFSVHETPCTTVGCAKQRTMVRFLMSDKKPWRVTPERAFCCACGALYRMLVPHPASAVGRVRAIRQGDAE